MNFTQQGDQRARCQISSHWLFTIDTKSTILELTEFLVNIYIYRISEKVPNFQILKMSERFVYMMLSDNDDTIIANFGQKCFSSRPKFL
jgi:hypothetical protein